MHGTVPNTVKQSIKSHGPPVLFLNYIMQTPYNKIQLFLAAANVYVFVYLPPK